MDFVSLWKVALHFGALSGLLSFGMFISIYVTGANPFGNMSWLGAWIPIVFIVLATRFMKNKVLDGKIRFMQAFKTGFNTVFAASVLFVLLAHLFGTLYDATIVDRYREDAYSEFMKAEEFYGEDFMDRFTGEGTTDQAIDNIEATTLTQITFGDFTSKMLGGIFVTLISSWIFSRKTGS